MRTAWYLIAFCGAALGCGTKIAQTTYDPGTFNVPDGATTPKEPSTCGPSLKARLSVTHIPVDQPVRYKRPGYGGVPRDERVALDFQSNGAGQIAWLDDALANVHVTPLTPDLTRGGPDAVIDGFDLGGIVAHDDGFAVLTRRNDPGEPIGAVVGDAGSAVPGVAPAAFLVRYRDGREVFAAPLTGTLNITNAPDNERRDFSMGLFGRLAFNGLFYGAYFVVRGGRGDFAEGRNGDKLVFADPQGNFLPRGGWTWGCSQNLGLQLLPEPNGFTSLCISDGAPQAGLNVVASGQPPRLLAHEYSADGYSGGEFGSAVKLADERYFVGWASRGVRDNTSPIEVAMDARDIGFVVLSQDHVPIGRPQWLFSTSNIDEINFHVAPYGPDRLLAVWEQVTSPVCRAGVCLGQYGGTHVRLLYTDGRFASDEEIILAPPNSGDDIVVLPDGDLGWAFVADARDPSTLLDGGSNLPAIHQVSIARFAYCTD